MKKVWIAGKRNFQNFLKTKEGKIMNNETLQENSLSKVSEKNKVTVTKIAGGREAKSRLASMGMIPGSEIEVVRNSSSGPVIVSLDKSKLMLGRILAQKIMVSY
jgi:Fe2+ transport system protein FeoA